MQEGKRNTIPVEEDYSSRDVSNLTFKEVVSNQIEKALARQTGRSIFTTFSLCVEPNYIDFNGGFHDNFQTINIEELNSSDLFVLQIGYFDKHNQTDFAIDRIYDKINSFLYQDKLDECDRLLLSIRPSRTSVQLAITILMATIDVRALLSNREQLLSNYKTHLSDTTTTEEADSIFRYLE